MLVWFEKYAESPINFNKNCLIINFFKILYILLEEKYNQIKDIDIKNSKGKIDNIKIDLEIKNIILFSFVWSIGGLLNTQDRDKLNKFIKDLIKSKVNVNEEYKLFIQDYWFFDDKMLNKMHVQDD